MKLEEAIEILTYRLPYLENTAGRDMVDAFKLGIKALERERNCRLAHPDVAPYLLPGETEH